MIKLSQEYSEVIFDGPLNSVIQANIILSTQLAQFHIVVRALEMAFGVFSLFVPHYLMHPREASSLLMNQNYPYTPRCKNV